MIPFVPSSGKHDWWVEMVPDSMREHFPNLTETLVRLRDESENKGAALSLFWKIYDLSEKDLLQSLEELDLIEKIDNLERKLNNCLRERLRAPSKNSSEFFVYLHVASALLITLESKEPSFSERFSEIIDSVEEIGKYYYGDFEDFYALDPSIEELKELLGEKIEPRTLPDYVFLRSLHALLALMAKWAFELQDEEGNWEKALDNLAKAVVFSHRSLFNVFIDLDPQAPVETFANLWNNKNEVKYWGKLAEWCRVMASEENLYDPMIKWKDEEIQGLFFWVYASGLCAAQLSLTEHRSWMEANESYASEQRLTNYFFFTDWENIPQPLRGDLKAADTLWFSKEKLNLAGILGSLKRVTERLMRIVFWEPFVQWRDATELRMKPEQVKKEAEFKERLQELQRSNHQPSIADFLVMLRLPSFGMFIEGVPYLKANRENIQNIVYEAIMELNKKRRLAEHPKNVQRWQKEDIAPLLKKFFGINEFGVLPFLARMLKVSDR